MCIQLQLVAESFCGSCSQIELAATRCSDIGRTFNPKVAGSIPARPTPQLAADELFLEARLEYYKSPFRDLLGAITPLCRVLPHIRLVQAA